MIDKIFLKIYLIDLKFTLLNFKYALYNSGLSQRPKRHRCPSMPNYASTFANYPLALPTFLTFPVGIDGHR